MKRYNFFLLLFLIGITTTAFSQTLKFRSGVFLHHSTGECIWGPNGSATSVPDEIAAYNTNNGLTGDNAVAMNENWWPSDDNEWATWDAIFQNTDSNNDIRPIIENNRIVVIKSCFPSSNIGDLGSPADTLDPTNKTVYNYKWHWRNILRVMAGHPENFFVIWTNAPLVANETNDQEARLSDKFCRWAKDTLATGADPIFGPFPSNVYVFDFFHKLADSHGKLPLQFASGDGDSHPNSAATELVAPQFVREIFAAAIIYETTVGVKHTSLPPPSSFQLEQNYPNPFNPTTTIQFVLPKPLSVTLKLFDTLGREMTTLVDEEMLPGKHKVLFDAHGLPSGIYFYRLRAGLFIQQRKMVIAR